MTELQMIPLDWIDREGSTQSRAAMDATTVQSYSTAMVGGTEFPPVVLFTVDAETYWIGDGHHRVWAAAEAGYAAIAAEVRDGNQRDALLFSINSNHDHGLRRSNEDKRRCVQLLLLDSEWAQWSDRQVAEACGVSDWLVRNVRNEMPLITPAGDVTEAVKSPSRRQSKDGKTRRLPKQPNVSTARLSQLTHWGGVEEQEDSGCESLAPEASSETPSDGVNCESLAVDTNRGVSVPEGPPTLDALAAPYKEVISDFRAATRKLKQLCEGPRNRYVASAFSGCKRSIDEVCGSIDRNAPHQLCKRCQGAGCEKCLQTGFVTKHILSSARK